MPPILRDYLTHIVGMILAGILWMASLYQLEIIYIWLAEGRLVFEFPSTSLLAVCRWRGTSGTELTH